MALHSRNKSSVTTPKPRCMMRQRRPPFMKPCHDATKARRASALVHAKVEGKRQPCHKSATPTTKYRAEKTKRIAFIGGVGARARVVYVHFGACLAVNANNRACRATPFGGPLNFLLVPLSSLVVTSRSREKNRPVPSCRRPLVQPALCRTDGAASSRVARDSGAAQRPDCRAHRVRQDAGCLPRCHRQPCPARYRGALAGRDTGRLRVAPQGAVQRHPEEPGAAHCRHP